MRARLYAARDRLQWSRARADLTPDQVVITVKNQPPISDAGPDKIEQVDSLVTLDGTASTDLDGDLPLQYLWTQSGGPSVTLSDPTSPSPTFTAPSAATVLTFTLFVTDTFGEPDPTPDQVVVTVSEPFYIYLPSVVGRHVIAPDLIVESIHRDHAETSTLVIRNQGRCSRHKCILGRRVHQPHPTAHRCERDL